MTEPQSDPATPVTINPQPRLYLIARDFHGRTRSALDFLRENSLPVEVIPVTIYEGPDGQRVVDIEAEHEPALPTPAVGTTKSAPVQVTVNGRRVTVTDLMEAHMLEPDEPVEFIRPRLGNHYHATVLGDGTFRLTDGTVHQSPSLAAMRAGDLVSYDGWYAWQVPRLDGIKLHELRSRFVESMTTVADDVAP